MNIQHTEKVFYTKQRQLTRYEAHFAVLVLISVGVWLVLQSLRDAALALFVLLIYLPVAIYSSAYIYALADTCLILSATGVEYKRPECRVQASWDQVSSMKRSTFGALFGIPYNLYLDAPVVTFSKWFGFSYRPLHMLFPRFYTRIPLGKGLWESNDEIMKEIQAGVGNRALGLGQMTP